MLDQFPDVLSVEQLAQALDVGLNTSYALVRSGKIPSVRVGKQFRIPKTALLSFLDTSSENR